MNILSSSTVRSSPKPAVSVKVLSHLVSRLIEVMDNAEGSSRSTVKLSSEQESVLAGTLLGDGCLAKHGRYHRLHIKHKLAHRALAELKYWTFEDFISMPIHRFDQHLGETRYPCVQFATRTSSVLSQWHRRFYREGTKVVPENIAQMLTPLALAVWFMDDGAADFAGVTFQTHSFRREEVDTLQEALNDRFGLAVNRRRNKGAWILYVRANSLEQLRRIVSPHLLPEFEYKLLTRRSRTP
jgi:recombination protein RecA